jgi:hypothetical protein
VTPESEVANASARDPLGYDFPLPLTARYYPIGCALDLATNSEHVLRTADFIWGRFPASWNGDAATIRIIVDDRDASTPPVPSMPHGQNHLVSFVHGPDNFAVCDLARSFTFVCLTRDVARDAAYLRYHFLEPAGYLMVDAHHFRALHASCVALDGRAVVLCGDAGAGKTSLAYGCARRGWTYLSDDATHIVRDSPDRIVAGRPFRIRFRESARRLFPELKAFAPELRPSGKLDIEVDTDALGLATALESRASHIVFLSREPGTRPARTRPLTRAEAESRLSEPVCYGDHRIRAAQDRTLANFLELPIVELSYSDIDDAERTLRALIRGV